MSKSADSPPSGLASVAEAPEELLQFLYRCPVGIVESDQHGSLGLINAFAAQLLMPLCADGELRNLYDVLAPWSGEVRALIEGFDADSGVVCNSRRVQLRREDDGQGQAHALVYSFTIHKLGPARLLVSFSDVSEQVTKEAALAAAIETQALQAGRIELATTILHDVGNAITGLGATIGQMADENPWPEIIALQRLVSLFAEHVDGLSELLGEGKGEALLGYTEALVTTLQEREGQWQELSTRLAKSLYHVQEILTIQRHFAPGGMRAPMQTQTLDALVNDALILAQSGLAKRGIEVRTDVPEGLPAVAADRTRMVQVLINLIRNAEEAFDAGEEAGERALWIRARRGEGDLLLLEVADNGPGFTPEQGARLFERGVSSKAKGGGLGLYTCRSTIEAHGGTIDIVSPGPGEGATVTIALPMLSE
ncbi:sensor histidine kinase [Haliangium ochraceum]|uniref:histidine kinase n=1 Tax=Haliangium ochraceum (strain DSM 14365 / JCM 11303 / SMP-2) TaxID=502025 RepID=D0LZM6_HALO1|nr:HAMP domain-containing sensor histidine kinase [Haliangium ochraceum]ACY18005.1 histidine kinase [Haliangium ochraceum DSM 14365]